MQEPNISPLSVLFLLGVVQAVFLAFSLLTARQGNRGANRYLAAMLFIFSIDLFNEFLDASLYGLQILEFMFITFTTDLLYGPLIWFYVCTMTGQSINFRGIRPAWHFLPFGIHSIVIWSTIPMASDPLLFDKFPELLLGNHIQPWIMNETFAVLAVFQTGTYLVLSIWILQGYATRIGDNFSYTEGVGLTWLRRLLTLLLIVYALYVFRIIFADFFDLIFQADIVLNVGLVSVIYSLGYFGIRQPAIFARLEHYEMTSEDGLPVMVLSENGVDTPTHAKYTKSTLSPEAADTLVKRLKIFMGKEKPYLENELNLPQLASQLGVSPNHLSQAINERQSLNFFDFVNGYRIEEAKRQLIELEPKKYNVLSVALDSGFNSKSAFYTSFKKYTGLTPTQFRSDQRP